MSLFDLLVAAREERAVTAPGRLNIAARMTLAARCAIRNAPKSREVIAEEMSELTGEHITEAMLNNWTAESHPHRVPGEWIPAFCIATGDNSMIEIQAEAAGIFTLPGIDALRAETQRLDEQIKELQKQKRDRLQFLRGMGHE